MGPLVLRHSKYERGAGPPFLSQMEHPPVEGPPSWKLAEAGRIEV